MVKIQNTKYFKSILNTYFKYMYFKYYTTLGFAPGGRGECFEDWDGFLGFVGYLGKVLSKVEFRSCEYGQFLLVGAPG